MIRQKIDQYILKYRDICYHLVLSNSISGNATVLDVGCGSNSPITYIPKTFYSEGIDIHKPNIVLSRKKKIHDKYTHGDVTKLMKYFKPKSFDVVMALDVIEHFPKHDAISLIHHMEKIAKKKVILLTPNGYYHQHPIEDNPYQEHRSGWTGDDLYSLGYEVRGLRGLKYLRKEFTTLKYKPWLFWALVSFISEPLLFFVPSLSYHLFAVKRLNS